VLPKKPKGPTPLAFFKILHRPSEGIAWSDFIPFFPSIFGTEVLAPHGFRKIASAVSSVSDLQIYLLTAGACPQFRRLHSVILLSPFQASFLGLFSLFLQSPENIKNTKTKKNMLNYNEIKDLTIVN
jgi:hypothetical protein